MAEHLEPSCNASIKSGHRHFKDWESDLCFEISAADVHVSDVVELLWFCRTDFQSIRRHMGQTRTIGAVKSYFSKNRRKLDLDKLAEGASARAAAEDAAADALAQVHSTPTSPPLTARHILRELLFIKDVI